MLGNAPSGRRSPASAKVIDRTVKPNGPSPPGAAAGPAAADRGQTPREGYGPMGRTRTRHYPGLAARGNAQLSFSCGPIPRAILGGAPACGSFGPLRPKAPRCRLRCHRVAVANPRPPSYPFAGLRPASGRTHPPPNYVNDYCASDMVILHRTRGPWEGAAAWPPPSTLSPGRGYPCRGR